MHDACIHACMSVFLCYLRDCKAGNGETRDDVRPKELEIVVRAPLENGEQELKSQDEFLAPLLVLESVERIIREEDFGKPVLEFLESCFLGWQTNTVYFHWWAYCVC